MKISLEFERWRRDSDLWKHTAETYPNEIREIETRGLWKTLQKVYDYLRLDSDDRLEKDCYIFDDDAIVAKVKWMYGGGQGESISGTSYYSRQGRKIGEYYAKPNVSALKLLAWGFENEDGRNDDCADPRIVATDIFVNALAMLNTNREVNADLIGEINAVLNPTFSFDEAFEFLEKNRFIGKNSKKNVFERDSKEGKKPRNKWDEVWEGDEFPGWWNPDREPLEYVPPRMRGVYDKFRAAYLEYKEEQRKERETQSASRRFAVPD